MIFLSFFLVFAFGTIIGSFLNVVIYRFNTGRTVAGRSACLSCSERLTWRELVPLVSFLLQRGKCAHCKSKISVQYPLVEFATGVVFLLVALKWSGLLPFAYGEFILHTVYAMYMLSLLIVIAVYDIRHKIIPNSLVYLFIITGFLGIFFTVTGPVVPSIGQLFSGLIIASPFWLLWSISRGKLMGFGDVKLMIGIGYFLGLTTGALAVLISFWMGALFAIGLLIVHPKNYSMKTELPFGEFLVLGTIVAYIFSPYLHMLVGF